MKYQLRVLLGGHVLFLGQFFAAAQKKGKTGKHFRCGSFEYFNGIYTLRYTILIGCSIIEKGSNEATSLNEKFI